MKDGEWMKDGSRSNQARLSDASLPEALSQSMRMTWTRLPTLLRAGIFRASHTHAPACDLATAAARRHARAWHHGIRRRRIFAGVSTRSPTAIAIAIAVVSHAAALAYPRPTLEPSRRHASWISRTRPQGAARSAYDEQGRSGEALGGSLLGLVGLGRGSAPSRTYLRVRGEPPRRHASWTSRTRQG